MIDCHAHFVPPSLLAAIRAQAAGFPSLRLVEDGTAFGFSFNGGKPTRPVSKPLSDLGARLKWMDEQKIDRQVVGGWLDMFGYDCPPRKAHAGRGLPTSICSPPRRESRVSFRWQPSRCKMAPAPPKSCARRMRRALPAR